MCELFGFSSRSSLELNGLLEEFFSHSLEHPNGWGMAFFYGDAVSLEKQPEAAHKSKYLKQRLQFKIETKAMIAHIRLATKGDLNYENTHPFVLRDKSERAWTLAHNGTIFACDLLSPFTYSQKGQTDSERILAYIIARIDSELEEKKELSKQERCQLIEEILGQITPGNKVNLLLFDGELMYVHTNYQNSLYTCQKGEGIVISTRPLDHHIWKPVPMNRLIAYQEGKQIYEGADHKNEFFETEETMRLLFLDFANL